MGIPAPVTVPPPVPVPGVQTPPQFSATPLPIPPPAAHLGPSPVLAFFLGFLPGLGAFYNEQYGKGMIHLAIFLVLFITGVNGALNGGAEAALWICLAALWVYMPIDALRTAKAKAAGLTLSDPLEAYAKGRPVGPIVLIGAGLLLLLNNFDWFPWARISELWPLILIGVGVLMFRNQLTRRP
jgi:hypothetical protein